MALILLFWFLLNLSAFLFALWVSPHLEWRLLSYFIGLEQLYYIIYGKLPYMLLSLPHYIFSIPLGALLLYVWLKKPTVFKAFLLVGLGSFVNFFAFVNYFFFIYSVIGFFICLVVGIALQWALQPE